MSLIDTIKFWNTSLNVEYFKNKPADPRVDKRLSLFLEGIDYTPVALDLGCGGGRHTQLLVTMGFDTHAVDLNPGMLRCTRQRVGAKNLKSLKRASIKKLPFRDAFFDAVVTTGVLHQAKSFTEYEQAVLELSRVLKPGGIVCLNIFTSKMLDATYLKEKNAFVYKTKEGLDMTLLSKETFYGLMAWYGLILETELSEDVVQENTGERSVLRCNFIKS
ncbi:hypothetical protein BH11PAT2_BH11PAT2_01750 [soil metagenome]